MKFRHIQNVNHGITKKNVLVVKRKKNRNVYIVMKFRHIQNVNHGITKKNVLVVKNGTCNSLKEWHYE
ncbi:hypothetical protein [Priestia flexa]|nr:hypothetical protein [Priestia flexa]